MCDPPALPVPGPKVRVPRPVDKRGTFATVGLRHKASDHIGLPRAHRRCRGRRPGSPSMPGFEPRPDPAAANAAIRRSVRSAVIADSSGFQRKLGTSNSGSPSIALASMRRSRRRAGGCCGGGSRRGSSVSRPMSSWRIELARERHQLRALPLGPLEPAGDVVADPAKRRPGGSPQAPPQLDGDRRRLVVWERRDVGAWPRALDRGAPAGPRRAAAGGRRRRRPRARGRRPRGRTRRPRRA